MKYVLPRCVKWIERGRDLKVSATGWCAVSKDNAPGEDTNVKTKCGMFVVCPGEYANREPDCAACRLAMVSK